MARVKDLWTTRDGHPTARHPDSAGRDGERRKQLQDSKRWQAVWKAPDGIERTKCFARRTDAEQFLAMKEKLRVRAELLASDGDGIDPAGFYVYLLWAAQADDKPVYVGKSANILSRLGDHLGDAGKRAGIGWVTLIRCTSEAAMVRREAELIRKYRPAWNKRIPAEGMAA